MRSPRKVPTLRLVTGDGLALPPAELAKLEAWLKTEPGLIDPPSSASEPPLGTRTFEAELRARMKAVFAKNPQLYDHRGEYPWLLAALGNPRTDVWFVAENPSLAQLPRVSGDSPELQWSVSDGDKLLRWMLVRHGFKQGTVTSRGGWCCYITDVVKSASVAGDWDKLPPKEKRAEVEAWSEVLQWELEVGQPKLVVSLGGDADTLLSRLIRLGRIKFRAVRARVDHYSFIVRYYDTRRKLKQWTPERFAIYDEQFRQVATALTAIRSGVAEPLAGLDEIGRDRGRLRPAMSRRERQTWELPKTRSKAKSSETTSEERTEIRSLLTDGVSVERIYDQLGRAKAIQIALWEEEARLAGELGAFPATPENAALLRDRGLRWGRIAARLYGDARRELDAQALYEEARGEGAAAASYSGRGRRFPKMSR
jgi:uracil-DNA glycosylase